MSWIRQITMINFTLWKQNKMTNQPTKKKKSWFWLIRVPEGLLGTGALAPTLAIEGDYNKVKGSEIRVQRGYGEGREAWPFLSTARRSLVSVFRVGSPVPPYSILELRKEKEQNQNKTGESETIGSLESWKSKVTWYWLYGNWMQKSFQFEDYSRYCHIRSSQISQICWATFLRKNILRSS